MAAWANKWANDWANGKTLQVAQHKSLTRRQAQFWANDLANKWAHKAKVIQKHKILLKFWANDWANKWAHKMSLQLPHHQSLTQTHSKIWANKWANDWARINIVYLIKII